MKKNILIIFTAGLTFLIASCRTQPVNLVRIPVKSKNAINFLKYKDIVYEPLKIEKFSSEYNPGPIIDYFFLNELPKTIKKTIKRYKDEGADPSGLKEEELLLVSGDVSLKIKERNVIDEQRGKKNRRVFIKVENWELQVKIFFRDLSNGKDVFSKTLTESLSGADKNKPDYNFEFLFRKITEKFVNLFMGLGRLETRYLLK